MSNDLLIIGVSARAAAASAEACGWRPWSVDLFADRDVPKSGRIFRADSFPEGLANIPCDFPNVPWLYTGGLENYPPIVEQISARRKLLGNGAEVLRRVRNPMLVSQVLMQHRAFGPAVLDSEPAFDGKRWLKKPRRSGGGIGISFYEPDQSARDVPSSSSREFYFQEFIHGCSIGALFCSTKCETTLLGITRQLIGCGWAGASGFQYVGSVAGITWPNSVRDEVSRLGRILGNEFSLTGVWGFDAILANDQVCVVEVNPRYTAAAEVVDRVTGESSLEWHMAACLEGRLLTSHSHRRTGAQGDLTQQYCGKAIVYSRHNFVVTEKFSDELMCESFLQRDVATAADIPEPGTLVQAGQPVVTRFADGDSDETVQTLLSQRCAETHARIEECVARCEVK